MSVGTILDALGRAGEAGDGAVAAELDVRGEPLLRARARRKLKRLVSVARARTAVADEAHVVRLAYLIAAGTPPEQPDDAPAVHKAFAGARRAARRWPRVWWASLALVAAAVGGAGAVAGWWTPRRARPAAAHVHEVAAGSTARAAFRPLAAAMTEYVVLVDGWARARRAGNSTATAQAERAIADARAAAMRTAAGLGPATARVDELLTAVKDAAGAAPWATQDAAAKLAAAVAAVDEDAPAYGVFFDGDIVGNTDGRTAFVWTYAVEHVARYVAGTTEIRALRVRQLDRLSAPSLAGLTRPHLREALVLLDSLEALVADTLLPALADGAPLSVIDSPDGGDFPELAAVETRAGEIARAELGAALGGDRALAAAVGATLGRRRELFAGWDRALRGRGVRVPPPSGLALPPDLQAQLAQVFPANEVAELDKLQTELAADATARGFQAVVAAMIDTIERHEVQHRLDYETGGPPKVDALDALGVGADERARAELSAYLGEIARDERTPRLGLTMIARFAFDKGRWGSSESFAAVVIVDGLARQLGMPVPALLVKNEIDRSALAKLYLALTDVPPDRLRATARTLWAKLFGAPLAPLARAEP